MTTFDAELIDNGNRIWILTLPGDIDQVLLNRLYSTEIPPMIDRLVEAQATKLVIDLSATQQLNSPGLQLLLILHRQLGHEHIPVQLKQPSPHLRRLLSMMQFDRIFEIQA